MYRSRPFVKYTPSVERCSLSDFNLNVDTCKSRFMIGSNSGKKPKKITNIAGCKLYATKSFDPQRQEHHNPAQHNAMRVRSQPPVSTVLICVKQACVHFFVVCPIRLEQVDQNPVDPPTFDNSTLL